MAIESAQVVNRPGGEKRVVDQAALEYQWCSPRNRLGIQFLATTTAVERATARVREDKFLRHEGPTQVGPQQPCGHT
jgi:hypothetical protein